MRLRASGSANDVSVTEKEWRGKGGRWEEGRWVDRKSHVLTGSASRMAGSRWSGVD